MQYKYVTDNNLENVQNYMYSEYSGMDFLNAYRQTRLENITLGKCRRNEIESDIKKYIKSDVSAELSALWEKSKDTNINKIKDSADIYVKRFEVKKRLYRKYGLNGRAVLESGYDEYVSYVLLGMIVSEIYRCSGNLKYLSCMLKITDTLISVRGSIDRKLWQMAGMLIADELEYVGNLIEKNSIVVEEM